MIREEICVLSVAFGTPYEPDTYLINYYYDWDYLLAFILYARLNSLYCLLILLQFIVIMC